MSGSHAQQWGDAIQEELNQLEKNRTWELVPEQNIKPGHKPLYEKQVFMVKRDVNGAIVRFMSQWVVLGYLQELGIDFNQTFAAVVKPMAFRVLFAIAAYYDLNIDQIDIKTTFLYGKINQLVYMQIPKGSEDATNKEMVWKLPKALYGLKQALRFWYERLSKFLLEKLGLKRINADHSIFATSSGINGPIVSTFVDDIKIMGVNRLGHIEKVKRELAAIFEMVDMAHQILSRLEGGERSLKKKHWSSLSPPTLTRSWESTTWTLPSNTTPQWKMDDSFQTRDLRPTKLNKNDTRALRDRWCSHW